MSGVPSWARPGVKVVCINDAVIPGVGTFWAGVVPPRGTVCTVRRAYRHSDGNAVLEIVEYPNEWGGSEWGWLVERFRPVRTIEDDLAAHFTHLLDIPASKDMEGV